MTYQDILTNPNLTSDIFQTGQPHGMRMFSPKERWELVAVGYEGDVTVTYLFATINGRAAELHYFSDSAFMDFDVPVAAHHFHISRLDQNSLAYADALDVDEFWVGTNRNLDLIPMRLPNWTITDRTDRLTRAVLRVR